MLFLKMCLSYVEMMQCDMDINHEIINVRDDDIIDEGPLRDDTEDENENKLDDETPVNTFSEDHEIIKRLLKEAYENDVEDDIIDIHHPMKLEHINRNLPKKVQKEEESEDIYTMTGELIAVGLIKLDAMLFNLKVKSRRFIRKNCKINVLFLFSFVILVLYIFRKFFL